MIIMVWMIYNLHVPSIGKQYSGNWTHEKWAKNRTMVNGRVELGLNEQVLVWFSKSIITPIWIVQEVF